MNAPAPELALRAFRDVDFNWAVRLQDIWTTAVGDVPGMHQNARRQLEEDAERLKNHPGDGNPLGWFLTGSGGTGKTHLLNAVQDQLVERGFGFILVDMTDVRDFWETVAQGYITSLQNILTDGRKQYAILIGRFISYLSHDASKVENNIRILVERKSTNLKKSLSILLNALSQKHRQEMLRYQDTIRALICLNSDDFEIANMGSSWLQGLDIDEALGKDLQFQNKNLRPIEIVRSLSWLMSLTGPTVLAFDQLDPIVHQVARQQTIENAEEQNTARWIIDQIGNGFGALRDTTTRTMVIVSCIEATYTILTQEAFSSNLARFHKPIVLVKPTGVELEALIRGRLAIAYKQHGFEPPYLTWPFAIDAFKTLADDTPRRVLQLCDEHRRRSIQDGAVTELKSFLPGASPPPPPPPPSFGDLDQQFAELRGKANPAALLDERKEDDALAQLYQTAMEYLKRQAEPLPTGIDATVDKEFGGGQTNRPLHARLRLILHKDNEREEHYCVRAIQKINHAAFKTRLKGAITQAGIDRTLTFRKLVIVRHQPFPGGDQTKSLVADFEAKGGKFHKPTDDELRTLFALNELFKGDDPKLSAWLTSRRPLDSSKLAEVLASGSLIASNPLPVKRPEPTVQDHSQPITKMAPPLPPPKPTAPPPLDSHSLLVGRKILGPDRTGDPLGPPLDALAKHTIVLAGAGSGKTVLLYRLVEEAALQKIPSIVVDCANDLSAFGDPKASSSHWWAGDEERARRFRAETEMVVWTPGKESGNPFTLQPLPDFDAVKDDSETLADALLMAQASLASVVSRGRSASADNKQAILKKSLGFFARHFPGGQLSEYVDMLRDLPDGAGLGVSREKRLAEEMADAILSQMTTNPLLNTTGATLDPAVLFGDDRPRAKTRISVVSLLGLPTLDMQRTFLNQLAMILFSWIKKHPHPPDRTIRGLLVVDEAKDFLPAQKSTECKDSLLRLGAQARKYGLGMVVATQHPKDIEHKLIGNSSTHFYGLNNSPASLATLQEQMKLKGGSGDDIARLKVGQFYFHTAGTSQTPPVKLQIPDCLSNKRLLEEQEILDKARASRERMEGH